VQGETSVVRNCAQEEKVCQGKAQGARAGRQAALEHGKQDCQQRDRSEDEKVLKSKKVKVGWHAAPSFSGGWVRLAAL
jgi:hypothetical protein